MSRPEGHAVNQERREGKTKPRVRKKSIRYPASLVITIRKLYKVGGHGYSKLAAMFSVPRSTVRSWVKMRMRMNPDAEEVDVGT